MSYRRAALLANITKSFTLKEVHYKSTIFIQTVFINADEDLEVDDQDIDVKLQLKIPVHTFESFILTLLELRKDFNVTCAYSHEPISFEMNFRNKDNVICDKDYTFCYWHSAHHNVLFSDSNQANVFLYISDFERYANLYVSFKNQ